MNFRTALLTGILALLIASLVAIYLHQRDPGELSAGHSGEPGLMDVTLRLPIPVADTAFAPYYLGIDKQIFERHGIRLKLEPGTPELNPVKMVSQNSDQFGVLGGPELLLSGRAKGAPIVGISLIHKDSDFVVLLTLASSGLTDLDQLAGERVGFFFGHISTDILRMLFAKEDVDVREVDVGFDYGPFIAGQLEAQWAFRTTAGLTLPSRGVDVNVISPADYGIVTNGHVVITNEKTLAEHPNLVQRFREALHESLAYSLEHVDEAVAATVARDPNFDPQIGRKQLKIYNPAISRNQPLGSINASDLSAAKDQMVAAGQLPAEIDLTAAIYAEPSQ